MIAEFARLQPILEGIGANAHRVDRDGAWPAANLEALGKAGLLGLVTPAAHGGLGKGPAESARVVSKVAESCGSTAMVLCMHYAGATVLAAYGSAEVNREIAAGRRVSTLAFSEEGSRSHFWAPLSSARLDGEHVVLDARKSWSTSARNATAYVWSSRPAAAEGVSTVWLVPRGTPGLAVPAPFDGLGLRGNDSAPITAEGVRIPAANRLGEDGKGFDVMMGSVLPVFNLMSAGCSVGLMEAALTGAAGHLSKTGFAHLGTALRDLPTARAYLAKARIEADMARCLWEDSIVAVTTGRTDAMLRVLQVKAAAGDAALSVAQTCMRVCGGAAYRRELAIERIFRDAQAASVMGPTSDVLYDFVGKALTGMDLF